MFHLSPGDLTFSRNGFRRSRGREGALKFLAPREKADVTAVTVTVVYLIYSRDEARCHFSWRFSDASVFKIQQDYSRFPYLRERTQCITCSADRQSLNAEHSVWVRSGNQHSIQFPRRRECRPTVIAGRLRNGNAPARNARKNGEPGAPLAFIIIDLLQLNYKLLEADTCTSFRFENSV